MQEPPSDNMTEERRRELVEMGFPDDGYDYLKHMRAPGRGGRGNLEGLEPAADPGWRSLALFSQLNLHVLGSAVAAYTLGRLPLAVRHKAAECYCVALLSPSF